MPIDFALMFVGQYVAAVWSERRRARELDSMRRGGRITPAKTR